MPEPTSIPGGRTWHWAGVPPTASSDTVLLSELVTTAYAPLGKMAMCCGAAPTARRRRGASGCKASMATTVPACGQTTSSTLPSLVTATSWAESTPVTSWPRWCVPSGARPITDTVPSAELATKTCAPEGSAATPRGASPTVSALITEGVWPTDSTKSCPGLVPLSTVTYKWVPSGDSASC